MISSRTTETDGDVQGIVSSYVRGVEVNVDAALDVFVNHYDEINAVYPGYYKTFPVPAGVASNRGAVGYLIENFVKSRHIAGYYEPRLASPRQFSALVRLAARLGIPVVVEANRLDSAPFLGDFGALAPVAAVLRVYSPYPTGIPELF